MRIFVFIFLLLSNLLALETRQDLMDSISKYAIKLGNGKNKTYTFIDPLCPKSQAYIELILDNKDLQQEHTFYIFLYQLPNFDSRELIVYIYQSKDPLASLEEVMVEEDYEDIEVYETKHSTIKMINAIAKVAQTMQIKARPYLLLFTKGSKYCRVSEGTAPCLEENDFD